MYRDASAVIGRVCIPCFSLCAGIYCAGGCGKGSLPIEYLMPISQIEAALKKKAFWVSVNCFFIVSDSSFAFVIIHRNEQVDDWWIGWLLDLPGVNAQEKTKEELIESLKIGAEDMLDVHGKMSLDVPEGGVIEKIRI